ncbi:MAG TPA: hypothetical protein VF210_05160 [Pseudomonadales bacterium]
MHWRAILTPLAWAALLHLTAGVALAATLVEEARLIEDQPQRRNYFGLSAAIDGDTAVIGTRRFGVEPETTTGGVVVFTRSGSTWQSRAELIPADAPTGDYTAIGVEVDLAGDVLVFSVSNRWNPLSGNVYVYTGAGGSWTPTAAFAAGPDDYEFGWHVATDGETLLIDSWAATRIYARKGDAWALLTTLPGLHGRAVDGDTAVLLEDTQAGPALAVFGRSGGSWTRTVTLPLDGVRRVREVDYDDGTIMVTGDVGATSSTVIAFEPRGSGWSGPIELETEGRPFDLALSGDHAIITGIHPDYRYHTVELLQRRAGGWTLEAAVPPPDRFEVVPALDGDTAILGVPFATDEAGSWFFGAAHVYRLRPGIGRGVDLFCAADLDGDGGNDLALVTAQREVRVRRLDGSAMNAFRLDPFGHLEATALLPDSDTNGAAELVSLIATPRGLSAPLVPTPPAGQVRDLLSGATLTELPFAPTGPAPHLAVLGDLTGNGMPELAVVHRNRPVTAEVLDSLTGQRLGGFQFSAYIKPRDLDLFPDLNRNGRGELAVLGDNWKPDRTDKIELRDPVTGHVTGHIWLGSGWTPLAQSLVRDLNGNGTPEAAILRTHPDGRVNVVLIDLASRLAVGSLNFPADYPPQGLLVIPDVNGNGADELVVLGRRHDGFDQKAMIRDSKSGAWLRVLWFDRHFPGQDFVSCGDLNGNGAHDVALLGYDPVNGRNKVIVKDTATGERLAHVRFW